jgi:hypothetical protein
MPVGGIYLADWGVRYADSGLPLVRVATTATPVAGQYKQSGTSYTFGAADTGKPVLISFEYTQTVGATMAYGNILQGATSFTKIRYQGVYSSRRIGVFLPNVTGAAFDVPTRQKEWVVSEMDFSAFTDPSGNVAYLYSTETAVGA